MLIVPPSGDVKAHCFRLEPKDELKKCLVDVASVIFARIPEDECSSLFVMTCVGSLSDVTLRLANASKLTEGGECNEVKNWSNQRFEIVSLVGTFSRDGACHLHLSMSDAEGNTFGGHLISGTVFTTAEVVIGSVLGVSFERELDERTGYRELSPKQIIKSKSWFQCKDVLFWIALGFSINSLWCRNMKSN